MSYQETILRQYSGLEKIYNLIDTFDQAVSMDDFTDTFIDHVWDVLSNGTYGLDVWGKIVNIGRYITTSTSGKFFGFQGTTTDENATFPHPFNQHPFYAGKQETTNVRLGNDAYRTLILAKAFSNISIATIPDINKFLTMMFKGRGIAYIVNNKDMSITVITNFSLYPYELAILQNYDVIPIPSGVLLSSETISGDYFGFGDDKADFSPFDQDVFNN